MTRAARQEFSSDTKRQAYARSRGICECHLIPHVFPTPCGLPLGDGNTFYEHITPDAYLGRNDLANCAALTKTCWRFKTDTFDLPTIAKTERNFDAAKGIKDRWRKRLPGSRDSGVKISMTRGPVDRRTGERLR